MKKRGWFVVVAGVLIAGLGAGWMSGGLQNALAGVGAGRGKDEKPQPALEFSAREVVRPERMTLNARVEFSGPLVAPQTAIVRAKASGTLLALDVAEGSRVRAGQPIGRIDLADLTSRVDERRANLESARATLTQAERNHASNEGLAAQHFISPMALANSRAGVETARAALAAAEASLETSRAGLRNASLVAPISGIVSKRYAVPGEKLAPEQQVLTIVDIARLELAGSVATHEVSRLAPGMAVALKVEGLEMPVAGRIVRIAPAADPGTRAIGVAVAVDNPKEVLRAGQYASASVVLPDPTERLTLPESAVFNSGGQNHVWVLEKGRLAERAITLGRRDENTGRVEVLAGLAPAARVLAARFDNLREGAPAGVAGERAAAPTADAASAAPGAG